MSDSDTGGGVPLIDPAFAGQKKRKRDDAATRSAKKSRRNKKPNDIRDDDLDEELGLNLALGRMEGQILVDYIARRTKKYEPDLSTIELDELYLPGNYSLLSSAGLLLTHFKHEIYEIRALSSNRELQITCLLLFASLPSLRRSLRKLWKRREVHIRL